jgi:hypothetical protein
MRRLRVQRAKDPQAGVRASPGGHAERLRSHIGNLCFGIWYSGGSPNVGPGHTVSMTASGPLFCFRAYQDMAPMPLNKYVGAGADVSTSTSLTLPALSPTNPNE